MATVISEPFARISGSVGKANPCIQSHLAKKGLYYLTELCKAEQL